MNDPCRSCHTYEIKNGCCSIITDHPTYVEKCPCRKCIIMVMCKKECEDYEKLVKALIAIEEEREKDRYGG